MIVIPLFCFVISVLYSSKEDLQNSSSNFWHAILSSRREVNLFIMLTLGNVPSVELEMMTLHVYINAFIL